MIAEYDLNLLSVAVAVYEEKSVSEAARRLGLTQSSTSQALAKLRHIFRDELFVRSGYEMKPSAKGRSLALAARDILAHAKIEAIMKVEFEAATTETTFCIATPEIGELVIIPELLRVLKASAPHALVRTGYPNPEKLLDQMKSGEIDLACGPFSQLNRAEFMRQKLLDVGVVCLIRSDHPFRGTSLTTQEYANFGHVAFGGDEYASKLWDRLLKSRRLKRRIVVSTTFSSSLPGILKSCDALATLTSAAAVYFSRNDPQLRILKAPVKISFPLYQYWHSSYQNDPRSQFLRRAFRTALHKADLLPIAAKLDSL
jgi:DNA-binding transcriptional LysR family regulator